MDKQNTTPPDMIAQAGELLRRYTDCTAICTGAAPDDAATVDGAIVIASAVLAVAGELRELRNVLAMAMENGTTYDNEPMHVLRVAMLK